MAGFKLSATRFRGHKLPGHRPSFPVILAKERRKRESRGFAEVDSRFRGNDGSGVTALDSCDNRAECCRRAIPGWRFQVGGSGPGMEGIPT